MSDKPAGGLTRPQVEAIAAGLYYVAATDGVDPREVAMIRDFLAESGATDLADKLDNYPFDPAALAHVLDTEWLRQTFLKAAFLLVNADGKISSDEKNAVAWLARQLGVHMTVSDIEKAVTGLKL